MTTQDYRQSKKWSRYLASLGWTSVKTSKKINIEIAGRFGLRFAKVQRPTNLDQKDTVEIDRICRNSRCLLIKIEPSSKQQARVLDILGFKSTKATLAPTKSLVLDLSKSKQQLRRELSKSARYALNRTQKDGIFAKVVKNPSSKDVDLFYAVYKELSAKTHVYSKKDISKKIKAFGGESFLVHVFSKNNECLGSNLYVGNKNTVWYLHGTVSAKGRLAKAGYLLFWESILAFKKVGFRYFDFEGIEDARVKQTSSWKGFTKFKKKFGGHVVIYPLPRIKYYSKTLETIGRLFKIQL